MNDARRTKQIFGALALAAGAGYLYYRHQEKQQGVQRLSGGPSGISKHRVIDTAMGFMKMNPVAKAIISETLKKAIPDEEDTGEVIDADYEVL